MNESLLDGLSTLINSKTNEIINKIMIDLKKRCEPYLCSDNVEKIFKNYKNFNSNINVLNMNKILINELSSFANSKIDENINKIIIDLKKRCEPYLCADNLEKIFKDYQNYNKIIIKNSKKSIKLLEKKKQISDLIKSLFSDSLKENNIDLRQLSGIGRSVSYFLLKNNTLKDSIQMIIEKKNKEYNKSILILDDEKIKLYLENNSANN